MYFAQKANFQKDKKNQESALKTVFVNRYFTSKDMGLGLFYD